MRINNKAIKSYISVMSAIDLSEEAKRQIIRNCALSATSRKIKARNYRIVPVKVKEKSI